MGKAEKDALLMVFVKNARLGHAKTRLAAAVGDEEALRIYKQLLAYTTHVASQVAGVDKAVYFSDAIEEGSAWEQLGFALHLQAKGDLGQRMEKAFEQAFQKGYKRVVIIGSDCPGITPKLLQESFEGLIGKARIKGSLGLAADGGYYLLGLSKMVRSVFQNKEWSTSSVGAETVNDLIRVGVATHFLPVLSDVDYEADWRKYEAHVRNVLEQIPKP